MAQSYRDEFEFVSKDSYVYDDSWLKSPPKPYDRKLLALYAFTLGLFFAINESIKAIQDAKEMGTWANAAALIMPTLAASGAAGYGAVLYFGLLTGTTVLTVGLGFAIYAGIAVTAALVALICKLLVEHKSFSPKTKKGSNEPHQLNYEIIKEHRFAAFWSKENDLVRQCKIDTKNLMEMNCLSTAKPK